MNARPEGFTADRRHTPACKATSGRIWFLPVCPCWREDRRLQSLSAHLGAATDFASAETPKARLPPGLDYPPDTCCPYMTVV